MGQCHTTARAHRERKREEAEMRQEDFESRSPAQQLALIKKRPGESRRERHRMLERSMKDD
jgi:hypothetical protein